ncbi:MAG: PspC domain-containing protein, partial [Nanoarchaeota archaeon]|nr:PspC domain-containing protein [Nanoarchaeota archaeon]
EEINMPKQIKRLYRNTGKGAVFGGVCVGIADYFEVDPVLIRLLWVLFTVVSFGGGIIAYLIAWIIIPKK